MKKPTTVWKPLLAVLAVLGAGVTAQSQLLDASLAQNKKTQAGTFWSSTMQMPPLPYLPFDDVPLTETGPGMFLYDDSKVDYAILRAEGSKQAAQNASLQGEGGGLAMMSLSGGLRLVPLQWSGSNMSFAIEGAEADGIYDLFATGTLGMTNAWSHAFRTAPGQTNINIPKPAGAALSFLLGTMLDTDGDSLSDALENLVTRTDPLARNTAQAAGANAALAALLTARPHELRLQEVHWRYEQIVLNNPCDSGQHQSKWGTLHWTNRLGGVQAETVRVGYCYVPGSPTFTNTHSEVYWESNDTWCVRFQDEGQPWTECGPHPDGGSFPSPREAPLDYRKLTNITVFTEASPPHTNYNVQDYQVKVEIDTGGAPLSVKQRLYKVTALAWTTNTGYVAPELITVAGRTLNSNSAAWFLWRDNTTNDVTPTLPAAYTNYSFYVAYERAELRLFVNDSDYTDGQVTVEAGQQVRLVCDLYPPIATITNYQWTIPNEPISNWVHSASLGQVIEIPEWAYTNAGVNLYWWKRATNFTVQCSVMVEGVAMTAKTTVTVQKRPASITPTVPWVVSVDDLWASAPGSPALHFGGILGVPGIWFERTHDSVAQWSWLQIITSTRRQRDDQTQEWRVSAGTGLDGSFPYPQPEVNFKTQDSPGMTFAEGTDGATIQESFVMYLMYKPPGDASIHVPVASVGWAWAGSASFANGSWSLLNDPNFPTAPSVGTSTEALSYPVWTNNFNNWKTNWIAE